MDVTAQAVVLRDRLGHRERWVPILTVLAVLAVLKVATSVLGITGAVVGVIATAGVLAVVTRRGRGT